MRSAELKGREKHAESDCSDSSQILLSAQQPEHYRMVLWVISHDK